MEQNEESALQSFERSIVANPDYPQPYFSIARIYLAKKDTSKAIEQYKALIEKNPKLPQPHMMMGTIYDMDKKYDLAAEHYLKALELNPGFAPAANNLAYHLAERTQKYDDALKYAQIAKEKLPDEPGVIDTLGLAYYKKKLYGNAVSEFLDAAAKLPDNPVIHFHLGLAYDKKGEPDLAIKSLKKALELNSSFEGADQARSVLLQLSGKK